MNRPNLFNYDGPDDFRRFPHYYLTEPFYGVWDLRMTVSFLSGRVFEFNGNLKTAHWHCTHRVDYNDYILTVQYERNVL